MIVEFIKEPNFSAKKCLRLTAQNSTEEAMLDDFFEESLDLGNADFFTEGEPTKSGFNNITIYKKV